MKNRETTMKAASDSWSELFEDVGGCGEYEPDLKEFKRRAMALAKAEREAVPKKYCVAFRQVSTGYAYVEAESREQAESLAWELWGASSAFNDEVLGNSEIDSTDVAAVHELPADSVAYRACDAWSAEDLKEAR